MMIVLFICLVGLGYMYLGLSMYLMIYLVILMASGGLIYYKCREFFKKIGSFRMHEEIFNNIFYNQTKYSSKVEKFFLKQGLSIKSMGETNQYDDLIRIMHYDYDLVYWRLLKKRNGNSKYMLSYLNNYYSSKFSLIKSSINETLMASVLLTIVFIASSFLKEEVTSNLITFLLLTAFLLMILFANVMVIKDDIFLDKKSLKGEDILSLFILSFNNGIKEAYEELEIKENQLSDPRLYRLISFLNDIKKNNVMVGNLILESTMKECFERYKIDTSYMFYFTISIILFLFIMGGRL